ncbi:hypothetical protein [Piscinibacter gummiphilus]|uniref:Uncharacterized protein n=1 Tax=Piscinibacter gummiphilus TaxID=946333 RepID=A0ABZ0D2F1_9BURK|nr:hypothetical protein [Piscinibacter gummiphilus]WOB11359.1 hypothetical protein RXV79_27605 [Piscinibacter gummiphilus]
MFVANSNFENQFLSGISSNGDRYYRAFELSGRFSWFIVTCLIQDDGLEMLRSVCCSFEEDLLGLMQPMKNARAISVQRLVASDSGDGRWEAREVTKVWHTATEQGKRILVTQDADGSECCGLFGDAVDFELGQRTLIFDVATGGGQAAQLAYPTVAQT